MSEILYTPLIEDMTWSYSRINCFEDCRYKWFLKYIGKYKEEPLFYASYGRFMHKLIEKFYKGEISKEDMLMEFLTGFSENVRGDRPPEQIVQSYIEKGIKYLESFSEFPYEIVAVEDRINFDIDGIPFVAAIDYIGKHNDDYIIIDNKSRELKPRSKGKKYLKSDELLDEMLKQLYIYSAAVKYKYGKFPKKLCFNCFKNGVFIEEDFNLDKYNETINWIKKDIEYIKQSGDEDFYPNVDYFVCRYLCGYSNDCCYFESF